MNINDPLFFHGRRCVVCGFTPMSVAPATVWLKDVLTGEEIEVPADALDKPRSAPCTGGPDTHVRPQP